MEVRGPRLTLRYAGAADAPALFELAQDAEVTRFFSWGPYSRLAEPQAYIASLAAKRERGELLDFLVIDGAVGPIGVTGLSELSVRNRHATVGTWFGRRYWGSGSNPESKALIAALAFGLLGFDRLTAWANTSNGRSQAALARIGFQREGVLRGWHRHGDELHDVAAFGMLRADWEASPLRAVTAEFVGEPPPAWVVGPSGVSPD